MEGLVRILGREKFIVSFQMERRKNIYSFAEKTSFIFQIIQTVLISHVFKILKFLPPQT